MKHIKRKCKYHIHTYLRSRIVYKSESLNKWYMYIIYMYLYIYISIYLYIYIYIYVFGILKLINTCVFTCIYSYLLVLFTLFIFYIYILYLSFSIIVFIYSLLLWVCRTIRQIGGPSWQMHFKSIPGCCEVTRYVRTPTYFLTPQYNLVMSVLL